MIVLLSLPVIYFCLAMLSWLFQTVTMMVVLPVLMWRLFRPDRND
jgi:uncharacterized membrane protein